MPPSSSAFQCQPCVLSMPSLPIPASLAASLTRVPVSWAICFLHPPSTPTSPVAYSPNIWSFSLCPSSFPLPASKPSIPVLPALRICLPCRSPFSSHVFPIPAACWFSSDPALVLPLHQIASSFTLPRCQQRGHRECREVSPLSVRCSAPAAAGSNQDWEMLPPSCNPGLGHVWQLCEEGACPGAGLRGAGEPDVNHGKDARPTGLGLPEASACSGTFLTLKQQQVPL